MTEHDQPRELIATLFCNCSDFLIKYHNVLTDFLSTIQAIQQSSSNPIPSTFRILSPSVLQITFTTTVPLPHLRDHSSFTIFKTAHSLQNLVLAPTIHSPACPYTLAVFDMDSTLIQQEVIDLLAARAAFLPDNISRGVDIGVEVSNITSRAMNGELDFTASLRKRVALLAGLPASVFEELRSEITITPGAETLVRVLRGMGLKTALLSGGFMPLATYVAEMLGIDCVHANELAVQDGLLTGKLVDGWPIVDAAFKKKKLCELADIYAEPSIEGHQAGPKDDVTSLHGRYHNPTGRKGNVLAVGDGANDLPMMWAATLGVAFNAKPKVQEMAPTKLNTETLVDVLYLLGLTEDDIAQRMQE